MKILVVLPRFPYPLEKGDKLRAYHQIRNLAALGHDIYLFCASHVRVLPEHLEALRPFCRDICVVPSPRLVNVKNALRNYLSAKSIQIGYWDSRRVRKAYREFEHRVSPDVIYSQMVRTMPWVSRSPLPKVMDFQDALSMNTERRMQQSRGFWHYVFHYEFKMLRSSEYNAFKIFDALTMISDADSEAIPHRKNGEIMIIPNGVDFDYFYPITTPKKYDIVFCGNMQYDPNVKAVCYLVRRVMPLVWKQFPNASVLLAGATPKAAVRRLAGPNVTVSGWVDDIRQCYASSRIFAAPMLTGSGLQNKLLEAMSMRIPCVTTSIANASLHAVDGTSVLLGDSPETFASALVALLADEQRRDTLADEGHRFVHQHFSWSASCQKLSAILQQAALRAPSATPAP